MILRIRDFEIRNRLFVGTGKYATYDLMNRRSTRRAAMW